jgi:cytochrome c-type biogenesis protein CcmE
MKVLLALLVAANLFAPSSLLQAPQKFQRQKVTVLGMVSNVSIRETPNGSISQFSLCDSRCVNVVQSGKPPAIGASVTVTGTFYTIYSNGIIQARNVILVE